MTVSAYAASKPPTSQIPMIFQDVCQLDANSHDSVSIQPTGVPTPSVTAGEWMKPASDSPHMYDKSSAQ